jgi:hypothetical protein
VCQRKKERKNNYNVVKFGLRLYFMNMIFVIQHTSLSLLTPTALIGTALKPEAAQDVGSPGTLIILQLGQANNFVPLKQILLKHFWPRTRLTKILSAFDQTAGNFE